MLTLLAVLLLSSSQIISVHGVDQISHSRYVTSSSNKPLSPFLDTMQTIQSSDISSTLSGSPEFMHIVAKYNDDVDTNEYLQPIDQDKLHLLKELDTAESIDELFQSIEEVT
jgi:hypothetical protein